MRMTAMRVPVSDLLSGDFRKQPGEWGVSYVFTPLGLAVSRASVVGRVVEIFKADNHVTLAIDDTTGVVRARFFSDVMKRVEDVQAGDLVDVIGKVREYQGERQMVGEAAVVLEDRNWWLLRKAEIVLLHKKAKKWFEIQSKMAGELEGEKLRAALLEEGVPDWYADGILEGWGEVEEEAPAADASLKKKVLGVIPSDDMITYTDIIKESGLESDVVDRSLQELITEGEIFEPRSGKFKRL